MELLLTDEQRLLQDSVVKMLAQTGGVKRTRELRARGGFDRAVHARMGAEGWFGLLVAQERGGLGLGLKELALVLVEAGRTLAPEPIGIAAAVSHAIATAAASGEATALAGRVIDGSAVVMPAIAGAGATGVRASRDGKGLKLDGACATVPLGAACDGFLVMAELGSSQQAMVHVPADAKGLAITPRTTVDGRPFADLRFAGVNPDVVVSESSAAHAALYDLLLFCAAAELVGVMSAALDITVEYLKTRKQFGKPIGSFQALQHRAVDDFARIVSTRSFVFQVANQGLPLSSAMASALKAHAGGKALEVTKSAIQMHGAIGFTEDCDIGLYLKRAMWLSAWLGNEAAHRKRFAALSA